MKGFFCGTTATTNEEYKTVIKRRMNIMLVIMLIGIVTLIVALMAAFNKTTVISEEMISMYAGVGSGLIAAGIALWIKNKRLLGNEEKLKESRLINTDERIREISSKAFRVAAVVMLVVSYGVALIGGLFYPVLTQALMFIICLFVLAYTLAYKVFEKKM